MRSSRRCASDGSPAAAARCGASSGGTISASKKTLYAAEQKRADVARARRRWMREQGMFDPARLVFIDETARTPRWCGCAAVLRVAHGSSTARRRDIGKQSPSWAACPTTYRRTPKTWPPAALGPQAGRDEGSVNRRNSSRTKNTNCTQARSKSNRGAFDASADMDSRCRWCRDHWRSCQRSGAFAASNARNEYPALIAARNS